MNFSLQNVSRSEADSTVILKRQSLALLALVDQGPSQVFLLSGFVAFVASFSIIATICVGKNLHKKNYVLVACLAQSDCLMAVCLIVIGLRRMKAARTSSPMVVTQLQCLFEESPRIFALACINGFFCTCAFDRFLAVATPKWYRMVYPKWLFISLIIINYLRAGVEVGVLFLGTSQQPIPLCAFTTATTTDIIYAQTVRNKVILSIVCFLFLATIATVYYRLGRVKRQGGNVQDSRRQMQTKVIWTLALMLGCYVITIIANSIVFLFIYDRPFEIQIKFAAFSFTFQEVSAVCNFTILILKNGDFRAVFLNSIKFKYVNNRLKPMTSIQGPSTLFKKFDVFNTGRKEEKISNIVLWSQATHSHAKPQNKENTF